MTYIELWRIVNREIINTYATVNWSTLHEQISARLCAELDLNYEGYYEWRQKTGLHLETCRCELCIAEIPSNTILTIY